LKLCLACGRTFEGRDWVCPVCGDSPRKGEFLSFAPLLADSRDTFDPRWFPALAAREAGSFWFRGRNRLILWALSRYFPAARSFLEVGCGTGFVLAGIARAWPDMKVAGGDILTAGLRSAHERAPGAALYQLDARRLPFEQEFDVVGAFDVLEHIDDDRKVLCELSRAAKPGGGILITVPQHAWLWSAEDEAGRHRRRYSRSELVGKLTRAGLAVERVTSFVSFLLPVLAAARLARGTRRSQDADSLGELELPRPLDGAFEKVLAAELGLIRAGFSFPAGGSLLAVARRR
jgi:SAM-dependent methyltransferase